MESGKDQSSGSRERRTGREASVRFSLPQSRSWDSMGSSSLVLGTRTQGAWGAGLEGHFSHMPGKHSAGRYVGGRIEAESRRLHSPGR